MNFNDRYDSLFLWYAGAKHLDWRLLKAQVKAESNFDPNAVSKCGAKGLSQFMDRTFQEWHDGEPGIAFPPDLVHFSPYDPEDAIRAQAGFMAWLLKRYEGDAEVALAAYNAGPGAVSRLNWKAGYHAIAGQLPAETRTYVDRIMTFYDEYKG